MAQQQSASQHSTQFGQRPGLFRNSVGSRLGLRCGMLHLANKAIICPHFFRISSASTATDTVMPPHAVPNEPKSPS